MLKLVPLLLFVVSSVYAQGFTCPTSTISLATPTGSLPTGATNITTVPAGTNCTINFDIPNNYYILWKLSIDFQSDDDYVYIFDNNNRHKYYMIHTGFAYYDAPLIMPARSAGIRVYSASGNTGFFMSYSYQSLSGYQQVTKNTGEYFPLSNVTGNNYYTITASSATDQVVASYAQRAGTTLDPYLHDVFVYDGDNINTATFLGGLDEIGNTITISSGRSVSLVNIYGSTPSAYFLGNDASTVQGFSRYAVILATSLSTISGAITDLSDFGAAYTFICIDCPLFYWNTMQFDSTYTDPDKGFINFQGQTPTHKREKLVKYDPATYSQNYLPQMLPADIFTINVYLSRVTFAVTSASSVAQWNVPFNGRKGYIFSPSLWTTSANNFNYEFRDDTQLYNYTLNLDKLSFPVNTDQLTLQVGTGNGAPTVNNQYPRDQTASNTVTASGNYMNVGLSASTGADVRLSFQMSQSASTVSTTTATPTNFICPTTPITIATQSGSLPTGATNITIVPAGTNCTFNFDIPNNFYIFIKLSIDFQSDNDYVYIFDNNNRHKYYMVHTGYAYYDSPLIMPARSAGIQVYSASGNTRFYMSYSYQSLSGYQQVTKNTGEYFPLSNVTGNNYYTISASSVTEQVVPKYGQRAGATLDPYLHDVFVYDGDNINTATFLGGLDEIGYYMTVSYGRSLSLVNLYGSTPSAYFLGNDASTVQGLSNYVVILAANNSRISGTLTDITDFGSAFTFICVDCSTYYWSQMLFDNTTTLMDKGFLSFQGQTPTHKREKLVRYDASSYTQNYLPQIMPSDIFTINLYGSRVSFAVTTSSTAAQWNVPYDGRKGYIFSPNLWTTSGNNNFNYEFRNDTQIYNYTLNMNKMSFPVNTDQMTLQIGPANGAPTVNNQYPRDQTAGNAVSASGNYMNVGLAASNGADVRLSYGISFANPAAPTTVVTPAPTTPRSVTTNVVTSAAPSSAGVSSTSVVTTPAGNSTASATPAVSTATVQTTTSGGNDNFSKTIIAIFVLLTIF